MENETPINEYILSDGEQRTMRALVRNVELKRLNVYDLNKKLEVALKQCDLEQQRMEGAVAFLGTSRGWNSTNITPDCVKITRGN